MAYSESILFYCPEYKALKIVGFRHGQQNWVVLGLGSPLDHAQRLSRIVGGFGDDLKEEGLANVIRAGAGYQEATGFEQLQGSEVNLFVAAVGGVNAVAVLSKGRRVQDDHVKLPPGLI